MNYRIRGHYLVYSGYRATKRKAKKDEVVEVNCLRHGWGPTTSDGGCLTCHRQYWGLTSEEDVVE